jgi:hypothetical protein
MMKKSPVVRGFFLAFLTIHHKENNGFALTKHYSEKDVIKLLKRVFFR